MGMGNACVLGICQKILINNCFSLRVIEIIRMMVSYGLRNVLVAYMFFVDVLSIHQWNFSGHLLILEARTVGACRS